MIKRSIIAVFGVLFMVTPALANGGLMEKNDSEPWTGCYAGAAVGYESTDAQILGGALNATISGYTGSLGVGCNKQHGKGVFGLFFEYGVTDSDGNILSVTIDGEQFWSINALLGYLLLDDRLLTYVKLGYGKQGADIKLAPVPVADPDSGNFIAGVGAEYMLGDGWSIGPEGQWWFADGDTLAPGINYEADSLKLNVRLNKHF